MTVVVTISLFHSSDYMTGERDIKALKVKCDNLHNGCQWVGELRSLEGHVQNCDYTLLPCTNKCTKQKEIFTVYRKDLNSHLANDCPRRQYRCPKCKQMGEYKERTTVHLETCPKVKVQCPNAKCPVSSPRCKVATHRSKCEYEKVACKYAELGCEERPLRKNLKKHEEDVQLHLLLMTVLDLKQKNAEQEKKIQQLETRLIRQSTTSPTRIRMPNYEKYKNNKKIFCSSPFQVCGYKLCIAVTAHGAGDGKGTHLSVGVHIMAGRNDDYLIWPFSGTFTVELLNQLENNNHHQETWTFPADNVYSKRVTKGEIGSGYGTPQFILNDKLNHQPANNCQYLLNDSLVFRVSVEVPDSKPWLECTL